MGLLNAVVDLSHHNSVTSFADAKSAGVLGIIHKATQGTQFTDAAYDQNRAAAKAQGLLWGAYHFAQAKNVDGQVEHFLSIANPADDELLVLDFEPNGKDGTMTLAEAEEFVTLVEQRTGRYPGLYSGQSFITEKVGNNTKTVLAQCWLWVARYAAVVPTVPPAWQDFTMWQYTDGSAGMQPHQVPGIGRCDRDKFNGDEAALQQLWHAGDSQQRTSAPRKKK
jgi:lysozyme